MKIISWLLLLGVIGFGWYHITLQNSIKDREAIGSRAISLEDVQEKKDMMDDMDKEEVKTDDIKEEWQDSQENTEVSEPEEKNEESVSSSIIEKGTDVIEDKVLGMVDVVPMEDRTLTGYFNKVDLIHFANGSVTSREQHGGEVILEFSEDFSTPNAPDLFVLLGDESDANKDIDVSNLLNLGPLQKKEGAQAYKITKEELDEYGQTVIIWCKAFNVYFSSATLK